MTKPNPVSEARLRAICEALGRSDLRVRITDRALTQVLVRVKRGCLLVPRHFLADLTDPELQAVIQFVLCSTRADKVRYVLVHTAATLALFALLGLVMIWTTLWTFLAFNVVGIGGICYVVLRSEFWMARPRCEVFATAGGDPVLFVRALPYYAGSNPGGSGRMWQFCVLLNEMGRATGHDPQELLRTALPDRVEQAGPNVDPRSIRGRRRAFFQWLFPGLF